MPVRFLEMVNRNLIRSLENDNELAAEIELAQGLEPIGLDRTTPRRSDSHRLWLGRLYARVGSAEISGTVKSVKTRGSVVVGRSVHHHLCLPPVPGSDILTGFG